MDRGAWWATVHRASSAGLDLVTKPPPLWRVPTVCQTLHSVSRPDNGPSFKKLMIYKQEAGNQYCSCILCSLRDSVLPCFLCFCFLQWPCPLSSCLLHRTQFVWVLRWGWPWMAQHYWWSYRFLQATERRVWPWLENYPVNSITHGRGHITAVLYLHGQLHPLLQLLPA